MHIQATTLIPMGLSAAINVVGTHCLFSLQNNWTILPLGGTREYLNITGKDHWNWDSLNYSPLCYAYELFNYLLEVLHSSSERKLQLQPWFINKWFLIIHEKYLTWNCHTVGFNWDEQLCGVLFVLLKRKIYFCPDNSKCGLLKETLSRIPVHIWYNSSKVYE